MKMLMSLAKKNKKWCKDIFNASMFNWISLNKVYCRGHKCEIKHWSHPAEHTRRICDRETLCRPPSAAWRHRGTSWGHTMRRSVFTANERVYDLHWCFITTTHHFFWLNRSLLPIFFCTTLIFPFSNFTPSSLVSHKILIN